MKLIRIPSSECIYSMSSETPAAATANSGDTVLFETKDAFSNKIRTENDLFASVGWATVNPATGPLGIRGANPGDVIAVKILDIKVAEKGSMIAVPSTGALGHHITHSQTKIIPIVDGFAVFNEKIKLPVSPMIGVIGTAPTRGSIPTGTPGQHGSNMDTKLIKKGTTVYLPVLTEGANLAIGDLHAVMADGEVVICGVEIQGEVLIKVDVVKGRTLSNPVLETEENFYCIGSAEDLDRAVTETLNHTMEFLTARLPLPKNEIAMLMSITCNLQISQVVDPLKTVRMEIPKRTFEQYNLRF